MDIKVELISLQQYAGSLFGGQMITPEQLYIAIARVSSNRELSNRANDIEGLIKYCLKNKHWSIFEQVNIGFYVQCPLFVAIQMLRHKTMCFQMFSQRYQKVGELSKFDFELRVQGKTNRQSSEELFDDNNYYEEIQDLLDTTIDLYSRMIEDGVSLETARNILPMCAPTELFINTNLRTLIHYLDVRIDPHAQKEHRIVANKMKDIAKIYFPITFNVLESIKETEEVKKKIQNRS